MKNIPITFGCKIKYHGKYWRYVGQLEDGEILIACELPGHAFQVVEVESIYAEDMDKYEVVEASKYKDAFDWVKKWKKLKVPKELLTGKVKKGSI